MARPKKYSEKGLKLLLKIPPEIKEAMDSEEEYQRTKIEAMEAELRLYRFNKKHPLH